MTSRLSLSLVLILFSSFIIGGFSLKLLFRDKKPASLQINTTPSATVYLDNKSYGATPFFKSDLKPGSYDLRLVPISTSSATLESWETKLTLTSQTTTIISRAFNNSPLESEFSQIELIPEPATNKALLSIVSDPDAVNITLDNKPLGFTPLSKLSLEPKDYSLTLSSPGYKSQSLNIKLSTKYNLLVNVKLAPDLVSLLPNPSPSPTTPTFSPSPSLSSSPPTATSSSEVISKPYITILNTPDTISLGGLNVRQEPNSNSSTLGIAKIGSNYPYKQTNEKGWHQIIFEGKAGWVSGKYTTLTK